MSGPRCDLCGQVLTEGRITARYCLTQFWRVVLVCRLLVSLVLATAVLVGVCAALVGLAMLFAALVLSR